MQKQIYSWVENYFSKKNNFNLFSLVRKWKQKPANGLKTASTSDSWVFEIGQNYETKPIAENSLGMMESTSTVCKLTQLFDDERICFVADIYTKW